ncbi:hypothetical protein ACFXP7_11485 [Microbacterium sp. P06]|uniref:hypothetical protein n=1 Tax=Microbacterium sp. P06 TaxID=3366949 RepID=UPI0037472FFA
MQFAAVVAGCTLLAGCATAQPPASEWSSLYGADMAQGIEMWAQEAPMSEAQRESLLDGRVTEAEAMAAFERYRSCLREAGYEPFGIQRDGPFINFSIPAAAVESGADGPCYAGEYAAVDTIWQSVENADVGDERTRLAECVSQLGLDFVARSGAATMDEIRAAIEEAGYSVDDCA